MREPTSYLYVSHETKTCVCVCVCVCVVRGWWGRSLSLKKQTNEVGHGLYRTPAENSADIFISHCHAEDLHNF